MKWSGFCLFWAVCWVSVTSSEQALLFPMGFLLFWVTVKIVVVYLCTMLETLLMFYAVAAGDKEISDLEELFN